MTKITFSKAEKEVIVEKVKSYFRKELNQDIGGFDAEFLIDFFTDEVGAYFYNRGLYDAHSLLTSKLEEVGDALLELEHTTDFSR